MEESTGSAVENQTSSGASDVQTELSSPAPSRKRKKGMKFVWILIIIIILAGLGGGAWYLLKEPEGLENDSISVNSDLSTPETRVQPTSTPAVTPTPAEVDREEVSIEVLNGTGIAGEAGFLKEKLEDLGYTKIEVGNASSTDNEETTVTFSSSLPEAVVDEITAELEKLYQDVNSKTSSSASSDSIEITTGLRKGQSFPTKAPAAAADEDEETTATATPTQSPTPTP